MNQTREIEVFALFKMKEKKKKKIYRMYSESA